VLRSDLATATVGSPASTVTVWSPCASGGGRFGIAASTIALGGALGAAWWATQQPVSLAMFLGVLTAVVGLVASLLLAAWTYGYYTLRYRLDATGLTIDWLFQREHIPYRTINAVYSGQRLPEPLRVRGLVWPGYYVGRSRVRNLGVLRVFASTLERADLTIVLSDLGGYVLSPETAFRLTLVERLEHARREGAQQSVEPRLPRRYQLGRALTDPWLQVCALASLAIVLAMLGYIMDRYESLPELLALRLDPLGESVHMRVRFELFHLPAVGAAVLAMDVLLGIWVYQWERLAARLLWGAPLLVQILLAIAVLRTIG